MHFAIDIREACRAKRAGKGQWTYGFTAELLAREHALTLYTDAPLPAEWQTILDGRNDVSVKHIDLHGMRWHAAVARDAKADRGIDAYVSTVSYIVPALLGRAKRVIPVVHDLIAFRGEPHDRRATLIERLTLGRAMRSSTLVCTVSETTKADLLARYPWLDPARVVPVFAAPVFPPANAREDGSIILCIATLCPRKNQRRLLEAYAQLPAALREKHPLVLVGGRGWQDEEIVALAAHTPGAEWKSYLSDRECKELMENAACFAYPSLYEGFGLPIIEAMAAGVPVLTSNVGSMREVASGAALLADPASAASIRDGLATLLADGSLRADYARRGKVRARDFSWKRTVDLFLAAAAEIDKGA